MNGINILQIAAFFILIGYVLTIMPDIKKWAFGNSLSGKKFDRRNTDDFNTPRTLLHILVLIISLVFLRDVIVGSTPFGSTTIDGVMEKRNYTENYYVLAFPDGSVSLNYKVKAEIHSYSRYEGIEPVRIYQINKMYMPEGGVVTFVHEAGSRYSLEPDSAVSLSDDDGRKWRIQLTKEKVR